MTQLSEIVHLSNTRDVNVRTGLHVRNIEIEQMRSKYEHESVNLHCPV